MSPTGLGSAKLRLFVIPSFSSRHMEHIRPHTGDKTGDSLLHWGSIDKFCSWQTARICSSWPVFAAQRRRRKGRISALQPERIATWNGGQSSVSSVVPLSVCSSQSTEIEGATSRHNASRGAIPSLTIRVSIGGIASQALKFFSFRSPYPISQLLM